MHPHGYQHAKPAAAANSNSSAVLLPFFRYLRRCIRTPLSEKSYEAGTKKKHPVGASLYLEELFLVFALVLACEQRADGQRNLFLLIVDIDDLGLDLLADLKHILRLCDAVVSDLGDVDQPVNAGTISANAPNGINLRILTSATSPTPYLDLNTFHGLSSSRL